ncbi:TonB family protein [Sinirhodobacter huangdaonensis]|uniref:TonB family protein n=1 Tax=Paenirhodobacter huangdaonensis TaxID=2501515 RepID=A0A3S3PCQ7_9RHOB|nr:TonB family protein [Sinirhodobacter huangdaonensis]RWR47944.1 TonB family protein [Sinirhodobacter huangdaonensis]
MRARPALEALTCLALALGLHLAMFGIGLPVGGAPSAGDGGDATITLAAADADLQALVDSWDRVEVPEPELTLPPTPPAIEAAPEIALPELATAPPLPAAPKVPAPVAADSPPAPQADPAPPPAKPAPKPAPKQSRREPAETPRKPGGATASVAGQRAAGSGGRGAQGVNGSADVPALTEGVIRSARAEWGAAIRARIERQKRYPTAAGRAQGRVTVFLTVTRAGELAAARIATGSGTAALDAAALDAVRRAGRFPPAPAALTEASYSFTLPISFRR